MDTHGHDSSDDEHRDGRHGPAPDLKQKQWLRKWKDRVITWFYPTVAYLTVVGAVLTLARSQRLEVQGQGAAETILLGIVAYCAVMWASFAFSGDPYLHRTHALGFAYFFILVSFSIFSLPAFFGNVVGGEPLGIVSGCVPDPTASEQVRCQNLAVIARQSAAQEGSTGVADPPAIPPAPPAAPRQLAQQPPSPPRNHWLVNVGGTIRPQQPSCDPQSAAKNRPLRSDEACDLGSPGNRVFVSGGMVVPLQFIVIALAGGAISLSRRVPEVQKKSETYDYAVPRAIRHARSLHVPAVVRPELSGADVRQDLVFQIVQFVSAPWVAAVAFQVIEPESAGTSAGLAFMCGFGSEAVLKWIKSIGDSIGRHRSELAGVPAIASATGAIYGVVNSDGKPQRGIPVRVDSAPPGTGITYTDKDGLYFLPSIQAGAQLLIVGDYQRPVVAHVEPGLAREYAIDLADLRSAALHAEQSPAGQQPAGQQPAGQQPAGETSTRQSEIT